MQSSAAIKKQAFNSFSITRKSGTRIIASFLRTEEGQTAWENSLSGKRETREKVCMSEKEKDRERERERERGRIKESKKERKRERKRA